MEPKRPTIKRKWPFYIGAVFLAGALSAGFAMIFDQFLGGPPWPVGFAVAFLTLMVREVIGWIIAWRRSRLTGS